MDRRRLLRLAAMLVLPLTPMCIAGAYPGPLEGEAGRQAAFVYCAALAGLTLMVGLLAYGSFVYGWDFRRIRNWPYIFGPPLASLGTFFVGGSAIVAFSAPAALEVPFVPAAVISSWLLPACVPTVIMWTAHARRRFEVHPHAPPDEVVAALEATTRRLQPASTATVVDFDASEPLAERAPPRTARWRHASISSPEEMAESLATPHGARRVITQLMLLFTGLLLIVYPMWGYLFLFSLFAGSGVAQVIISLAFSALSGTICFGFLRVFRSFLCALLPENGGQAFVILYLLHSVRLFRLMSSFQASSEYVLAFGVVSDLTVTFAPLFVARASRAVRTRLSRLLAFVVRPVRTAAQPGSPPAEGEAAPRGPPGPPVKAMRAWSASEGGRESADGSSGSGPPGTPPEAAPSAPLRPETASTDGGSLVREGGRALFFLQALANMMASLQFVAIITVLRYSRVAPLFPYHPAALPDRDYAACILAALASAACLSLGLALLHLLSTRAAALHHARRRAVKDGFELGWEVVDGSAWRVVAVWAVSSMVSAPALVRVMRIYSVVFPRAYLPLDI